MSVAAPCVLSAHCTACCAASNARAHSNNNKQRQTNGKQRQKQCLIGYCLFPINIAAVVCLFVKVRWARLLVLLACLAWASAAAVPFIGRTVAERRRALAVYPVLLMYTSLGWLALVKR